MLGEAGFNVSKDMIIFDTLVIKLYINQSSKFLYSRKGLKLKRIFLLLMQINNIYEYNS